MDKFTALRIQTKFQSSTRTASSLLDSHTVHTWLTLWTVGVHIRVDRGKIRPLCPCQGKGTCRPQRHPILSILGFKAFLVCHYESDQAGVNMWRTTKPAIGQLMVVEDIQYLGLFWTSYDLCMSRPCLLSCCLKDQHSSPVQLRCDK